MRPAVQVLDLLDGRFDAQVARARAHERERCPQRSNLSYEPLSPSRPTLRDCIRVAGRMLCIVFPVAMTFVWVLITWVPFRANDVFVDARRHRAYVVCGEGYVDVLDASGDAFSRIARIPTSARSRTGLFVPELDLQR